MDKDFKIDLENKIIEYSKNSEGGSYTIKELYSFLQDTFDEPEYMRYDLPIEVTDEGEFKLINGWSITDEARKHLEGNLILG